MVNADTEALPLEIPLGIPAGDSQKAFYAYLNSEFDKRSMKCSGVYNNVVDGAFELDLSATFKEQFGNAELRLQFVTATGGFLESVRVSLISLRDTSTRWRELAYELVQSALIAALSKRTCSFFMRRKLYYVGPELDGEYWLGRVRFAPAEQVPSEFPIVRWERAVFLDFEIDAIDKTHAIYLAVKLERCYAARLSMLLDVDLYPQSSEQVWVHLSDGGGSARCNRGLGDDGQPQKMPRKGQDCHAGTTAPIARQIFSTERLQLPAETRQFLRAIDQSDSSVRKFIDGASRLYHIGLSQRKRFPSAGLAYSVAAIDALSQTISPNSVSEFLRRFSPLAAEFPVVAARLWREVRSAHFHAGGFALGEFSERRRMDAIIDPDTANSMCMEMRSWEITREAIVNWIVAFVADSLE